MWKTMSKNNNKILEARLTRLETRQEEIQNDIKEIKEQVFNALPHKISNLENKIMEVKDKIFYIFGIGILATIITQLILRFLF